MRTLLPPSFAVALAGAATMAVEILLPRRLAPDVGTTLPVWTASIAVVLAGLALGNALGGAWADAPTAPRREAGVWWLAAVATALAPWLARAAAGAAASLPLAQRALVATAAGGLVPALALGAVYPLAAGRALRRARARGTSLGLLLAASALGSLLGTAATSYLVVPALAVPTAFFAVAAGLALVGVLRTGRDPEPRPARRRGPDEAPTVAAGATATVAPGPAQPAPTAAPAGAPPARGALAWAAVVGAVALALEVVAARRTAVEAGSSLEAWTAVLGVVLVGFALGGALGGRLATSGDPRRRAGAALLLASALALAFPWTSRLVHGALGGASPFPMRVAIGVASAFGPLFVALGAVSPLLARAAVGAAADAGRRAGLVSAAGTVGALAGTVVTGPFAVPALRLEGVAAAAAAALALAAGALRGRWRGPIVVAAAALALLGAARLDVGAARSAGLALGVRPDRDGVLALDGPYARVVVEEAPEAQRYGRPVRRMKIDARTHGIHDVADETWIGSNYGSIYAAVTEHLAGSWDTVRALFLGGGTYTAPRAILRRWPGAHVDVAEIDPTVTEAARRELSLRDVAGLSIAHEDGRSFVRSRPADAPKYDFVFADAFGDVGVPWHLTTAEFLVEVKRCLAPEGVFVANTIDVLASGRFVAAMRATVRGAFAHVEVIGPWRYDDGPANFIFVASDRPLDLTGLARVDPSDPRGPRLPVHRYAASELDALERRHGARPLTDDFAPVEELLAPLVEVAAPH